MRETWYVLTDGRAVDPNEVAPDETGALVHSSGVSVAVGPHGPKSRSVDLAEMADKALEAEKPKAGYKTREAKAR